ncbi:MAG: membrane dipeptidase, partial [Acidobacteria bacterium]|nr:membrane dipeptidase [Acidobacteriota bacterium]
RLGMMIDVSHVTDDTVEQVLELTQAPVVASHSSCRHFTPGWERNMSDEMIAELGDNGGVLQINFGSAFLTEAAYVQSREFFAAAGAYGEENGFSEGDPEMEAFAEQWWSERTRKYADVTDVVTHIDRVVELAGIDHVGLGSDFDGVGDSLPTGLKDVSQYPNLIAALMERGYSDEDLAKILGGNLLRVWKQVEQVAAELAGLPT